MNISWVLSDRVELDPTLDISRLKDVGSIWGGWKTWRAYSTDNVICNDSVKADELIKRQFQNLCNLYIPNLNYITLGRPDNVKIYEGSFVHDVDNQDEIVALHLAASTSDIVLLLGFDFGEYSQQPDKLAEHRAHHYRGLIKQAIIGNPEIQWVVVDHKTPIRDEFQNLENFSQDSIENVLDLLSN